MIKSDYKRTDEYRPIVCKENKVIRKLEFGNPVNEKNKSDGQQNSNTQQTESQTEDPTVRITRSKSKSAY